MNGRLRKALLLSIALAARSALLFDRFSFGIAHGNLFLVLVFGGTVAALTAGFSVASPWIVFAIQFLYYCACAVVVLAAFAILRVRRERLERKHLQHVP